MKDVDVVVDNVVDVVVTAANFFPFSSFVRIVAGGGTKEAAGVELAVTEGADLRDGNRNEAGDSSR